MSRKGKHLWLVAFSIMLLSATQAASGSRDVPGSKDHPLLSRYPGSYIYRYSQKEFDRLYLLAGPVPSPSAGDVAKAERKRLEGKVTLIQYQAPRNRSAYEVFRNYEGAVREAGFSVLYLGRGREISGIRKFLDEYTDFWNVYATRDDPSKYFYLAAKTPLGDKAISLFVADSYDGPKVFLGVVEARSMETGLITAEVMAEELGRSGHVPIYGILFDFDSTAIRPESRPVIEEIATLLRDSPSLKLYVVGHTDNVGGLDYNMDLSKRRAEAVVRELVDRHGIDADRLRAFGVGPLAPVATNGTAAGRAKNRRVELVEQ